MVYLRSEEHLTRWLAANGYESSGTITSVQMNALAQAWWWTRLDPGWRPLTLDESQAILDALGLVGEFWSLA